MPLRILDWIIPFRKTPSQSKPVHGNRAVSVPFPGSAGRIARLESFRGLGALAVLITHSCLVIPWDGAGTQLALIRLQSLFINGHAALMIFFVISGYVLGLSLDKGAGSRDNVSHFYTRRVFRIYPAHVVSIGFIAAALLSLDDSVPPAAASQMFANVFAAPLSVSEGVLNSLLLRVTMNGIAWTLALEMAISLAFPLLYSASRHPSGVLRAGVLIALVASSLAVGNRITQAGVTLVASLPSGSVQRVLARLDYVPEIVNNMVLYGYVFYLGLVAEPVFKKIVPRIDGRFGSRLMWLALFFALTAKVFTLGRLNAVTVLIEVVGATFLVFCGAMMQTRNRIVRALDRPFFHRLGTISYSFYLYHFIVVYCVATVLFRIASPEEVRASPLVFVSVVAALSFLITGLIASISYRTVEVPMIAYSKNLRRRRHLPA